MTRRSLLIFLVIFIISIIFILHFIDKRFFLSPIEYRQGIIIRQDELGEGDFGARRRGGRRHNGIDLFAPVETEVRAVSFSWVTEAEFHKKLGNYVELRHPGNIVTIYGHLSRIRVKSGHWIQQGEIIGYVGKTGNADHPKILPHLHFEIRESGIPVNPLPYLEER